MGSCSVSRTLPQRLLLVLLALSLHAGILLSQTSDSIDPAALQQIQALLSEKRARTPAQRKVDSNLLYEARQRRGQAIATGVPTLRTGIEVDPQGRVVVDIKATVTDPLLDTIEKLGGHVASYHYRYRSIRAELPLQAVETLAAHPNVTFVQPKQRVMLNGTARPARISGAAVNRGVTGVLLGGIRPGFAASAMAVRQRLAAALSRGGPRAGSGAKPAATNIVNTSEGVVTHRADLARQNIGAAGAGVKIGVLSDGVDFLSEVQATGDLPFVTVLPGQAGFGQEGTAMLEIVHDMAPAAQLYFATAFNGIASFAQNIRDLRTAGCDIIVDDVSYFVETPFQKGQTPSVPSTTDGGLVTQAVNDVVALGAMYFSSAANSGNKNDGTSGTWEGDFADAGAAGPPIPESGRLHDFDPGAGMTAFDTLTASGSAVDLFWSDPLGGSSNDYDVFLLNSTGTTVVGGSANVQDGTQDPFEEIGGAPSGDRIVIVKFSGSDRFLHLDTSRGRLTFNTQGSTHGHNAPPSANAFGVAATPAVSPGPYPSPFNSSNTVETFSSDGPRQFFFNADSTAITPGNFSSTGGQIIQQPMVTAADGVACAAPDFDPFYGTSAAAPHAAAIAALVKSAKPSLTPAQITTALTSTAIDIEAMGVDRDSGSGILDALAAVQSVSPTPQAVLLAGTVTVSELVGNGNTYLEPGECGSMTIQLTNGNSTVGATGISAVLSTSTPGVTIVAGTSAYPNISGGGSGTNTTPFQFTISNSAACPLTIDFKLTITFTGGASPEVLGILYRAGLPAVSVTTTLDTTAPPVVSGVTSTATGLQTLRLSRDGFEPTCTDPKSFPGTFGSGTRRYDAYTFTNCSAGPACIIVTLTQNSGTSGQLFAAAYSPSFNPSSLSTNYVADAGLSPGTGSPATFSFNVAAGATFVVVVNEIDSGAGVGASYTLKVDGACLPCPSRSGTGCVVTGESYFTVAPCRVADTRDPPGPSGGPPLGANTIRSFPVTGICGIPPTAKAVFINLAVFLPNDDGDLRLFPAGGAAPFASTINFRPFIVRANNATIPLGSAGQISVQCDMPPGSSGSTHFFFDVYGYYE